MQCNALQVRLSSALRILSAYNRRIIFQDESRISIFNDIRNGSNLRRQYRSTTHHGLEHDIREPFGIGRKNDEPELVQVFREVLVGDPAGTLHATREVLLTGESVRSFPPAGRALR